MVVRMIDLSEKKLTLTDLLEQVRSGEEILLLDGDTPLARIMPEKQKPSKRVPGLDEGALLWMSEDFDDPLPDEFWLGEEV
jgi:antitoxin (DNA-binding transcriptional repressor) of toxin-antitoxin stability system